MIGERGISKKIICPLSLHLKMDKSRVANGRREVSSGDVLDQMPMLLCNVELINSPSVWSSRKELPNPQSQQLYLRTCSGPCSGPCSDGYSTQGRSKKNSGIGLSKKGLTEIFVSTPNRE